MTKETATQHLINVWGGKSMPDDTDNDICTSLEGIERQLDSHIKCGNKSGLVFYINPNNNKMETLTVDL
jgi:hypothetical protein